MSDTFGRTSSVPFAFFDPESSSLKTSQGTLDLGLTPSSVTLPPSGSMRSGRLFERPTSGPATSASGSSSLLPTPIAPNGGRTVTDADRWSGKAAYTTDGRKRQVDLPNFVKHLLPTPAAQEPGGTPEAHLERKNRHDGANRTKPTHLSLAVMQLLPTPTTSDAKGPSPGHGGTTAETVALLPTPRTSDANGAGKHGAGGPDLRTRVHLLPTPRVSAERSSRRSMVENRQWSAPSLEQAVELAQGRLPREFESWDEVPGWLGDRTSPVSGDTHAPSDDPPPCPPTRKGG